MRGGFKQHEKIIAQKRLLVQNSRRTAYLSDVRLPGLSASLSTHARRGAPCSRKRRYSFCRPLAEGNNFGGILARNNKSHVMNRFGLYCPN